MNEPKKLFFALWTAITFLLIINIIIFSLELMRVVDLQLQYIPDDGYYYLTLARNFSSTGEWTFDSGISLTSGFHLLFGYLLVVIFPLVGFDANSFVMGGMFVGLFFTILSILVLWYWSFGQKNVLVLMMMAVVITSENFLNNTISVTEWGQVVFISSLYAFWFFYRYRKVQFSYIDYLVLFFLGLLSSLARTDSGLLPFSIFAATSILLLGRLLTRGTFYFAIFGLIGSITGIIVVFGHNYIFFDEFLQSSARMKAFWAQFAPLNYYAAPLIIGRIIGFFGLILLASLLAAAVFPKFFSKKDGRDVSPQQPLRSHEAKIEILLMLMVAGICVAGYTLFYARSGSVRPWYTSNLIVPVFILIFALSKYLVFALSRKALWLFTPLFVVVIIFNVLSLYPISSEHSPYPHQVDMYEAGIYLHENFPEVRVGSWNAGIIGYYADSYVVNLDGLVNNDIYDYAVSNSLPDYISDKNIAYILDFENVFTSDYHRIRGGYDDDEFLRSLQPIKTFSGEEYGWKNLTLFKISGALPPD